MREHLASFGKRLARDERGGTLVEFALVSPIMLTLLFGVIQVGLHVQNANAVRNLAARAPSAVVEYQRGNSLSANQIAAEIRARGVGPKYHLNLDRLDVVVTEEASRIGGVDEMSIAISYDMPNYLAFVDLSDLTIEYERPVFLLPPT